MARSSAEKMRTYRTRMRAKGLRQVQIWVPDTRTPEFIAEAKRQSRLAARSESEHDELSFWEAVQAENLDLPDE
jgi:hypothetical protein